MATKRKNQEKEDASKSKKQKSKSHWALGLLSAMSDPNLVVKEDDRIVIIKDKFPKVNHFYNIC